jgi:tetratricopeptide (TPR) repeat protein
MRSLPKNVSKKSYTYGGFQIPIMLTTIGWVLSCQSPLAQASPSTNSLLVSPGTNTIEYSDPPPVSTIANSTEIASISDFSKTNAAAYWEDINAQEHFAIYLDSPEMPKAQVDNYLYEISLVISCLNNNDAIRARSLLDTLSQNVILDAGLSDELGHRIDTACQLQTNINQMELADSQLQDSIDQPDSSPDELADAILKQSEKRSGGTGNTKAPSKSPIKALSAPDERAITVLPPPAGIPETTRLTQEYIRMIETKAQIKANKAKEQDIVTQNKLNFTQYISQLYESHHYYHVIMASAFYKALFKDNHYPVEMDVEVTNSSNINDNIFQTIEGMQSNSDKSNIATAANQLLEAYILNASDPRLFGVSLTQKASIKTFETQFTKLQNMIQARDFNGLDAIVDKLHKLTPDFEVATIMSSVNAIKSKSQLSLNRATLAIQQGNLKQALENLKTAENVWPNNPDLGDAFGLLNSEEVRNRSLTDFDRLWAAHDYFAISNKRMVFSSAFNNDSKRKEQLKGALERVKAANLAIEKADAMQSHGDVDGAWETLQLAIQKWPDSVRLAKLNGELADKAADLASAINRAQEAESRQQIGYSLSWYAVAQHYYPASQIAAQAIQRLSKCILVDSLGKKSDEKDMIR